MILSELSPKQIARARTIFNAAAPFGAEAVAGALMTAAAESSYTLYANDGTTKRLDIPQAIKERVKESLKYEHDAVAPKIEPWRPIGYWDTTADSMGHFQQRLMYNYGTIADMMDPAESTRIFLRGSTIARTRCFLDSPKTLTLPQRCQWTQGSEFPTGENYEKEAVVTAQLISLFVQEADWLDMATKEEVKSAFTDALSGIGNIEVMTAANAPDGRSSGTTLTQFLFWTDYRTKIIESKLDYLIGLSQSIARQMGGNAAAEAAKLDAILAELQKDAPKELAP